jgi:hypothetical protein
MGSVHGTALERLASALKILASMVNPSPLIPASGATSLGPGMNRSTLSRSGDVSLQKSSAVSQASCEGLVSRHPPQSLYVQSLGDTFEHIALVRITEMEQCGTAYAGRQTGLIRVE